LLTSVFFCTDIRISRLLASWYYTDGVDTDVHIRMFADVIWVGFLPPVGFGDGKLIKKYFSLHFFNRPSSPRGMANM
jgi:hypothetical protein